MSRSPVAEPTGRRLLGLGPALLLAFVFSILWADAAPAAPARPGEGIEVHFKNADIADVARSIARAAGQQLIFADEVGGNISITVRDRVSAAEAMELLFAALYLRGFAAVPIGEGTLKIVKLTESVSESPVVTDALDPLGDESITTMIRLENADAESVVTTLGPFISRNAVVLAYPPTQSIIIAAIESQIRRLITIVRVIDRSYDEDILVRTLRFRTAENMSTMVEAVFNENSILPDRVEMVIDERTNTLIARARPARLAALREFVVDMDRPAEGGGEFRIVRILNREPEDIANALQGAAEGDMVGQEQGTGTASLGENLVGRDYSITVDAPTRSLIVRSDPETFDLLASLIVQLDRIPPRISVEVLVLEIQRPSAYALGMDFLVPLANAKDPSDLIAAVTSRPDGRADVTQPSPRSNVAAQWTRRPLLVSFTGPDGNTITTSVSRGDASFEAREAEIQSNVLLRPQLVVVSGEEHEIFTGNNVPVPVSPTTSSTGDAGVVVTPLNSTTSTSRVIERQDVGVRLRVKPTAGTKGDVRLKLDLDVSEIGPSLAGSVEEVGPTIEQRKIEATIRIREGEYAVLATQSGKRVAKVHTGIPYLMNIPFLGFLFGRVEEVVRDTELVVIVTARQMNSLEEDVAESIRRRLAFERAISRVADLGTMSDAPYAVLLDSVRSEEQAKEIAAAFESDGFETRITSWEAFGTNVHDVYIVELRDFDAGILLARRLADAGWPAEVTILSPENEFAGD